MRNSFDPPLALGYTPINEAKIPTKTRSHLAALAAALQHIYVNPPWNTIHWPLWWIWVVLFWEEKESETPSKHSIAWVITPEKLYAPTDRIPGYTSQKDLIIKIINRYENNA
ncbi:MAG: hypothetical protein AAGI25_06570 [Bacteroidota bacterium]